MLGRPIWKVTCHAKSCLKKDSKGKVTPARDLEHRLTDSI